MRLWLALTITLCSSVAARVHAEDAGTPIPPEPQAPELDAPATAATQAAPTEAAAAPDAAPEADLSKVRAELSRVMDELIAARARTSLLAKALFNTPLSIRVARRADDQQLEHVALRLDGVPVHDSDGAALAQGAADLFEGFVGPGVHEIAIEVAEAAKVNATYRYVRTERFRIEIKKGMRTRVELLLRDRSDMAEELPTDEEGEYDVSTLMRVEAEPVKAR